jgi:hypothetical protein
MADENNIETSQQSPTQPTENVAVGEAAPAEARGEGRGPGGPGGRGGRGGRGGGGGSRW